jgi:hypothetical protein
VFVDRHEQGPIVVVGSKVITDKDKAVGSKHRPQLAVEVRCTRAVAEFMQRLEGDRHIDWRGYKFEPFWFTEVSLDEERALCVLS